MEISTLSDWIIDNHPDIAIDEYLWAQNVVWTPGDAWYHMCSEKHDKEFVVRYEDYETIKGAYEEYVCETIRLIERERRRLY